MRPETAIGLLGSEGKDMERKEAIRSAYRLTGGNNFYDGILTMPLYRTLPKADITCLDYSADMMGQAQEKAGFFTPPYETTISLKKRLGKLYKAVTLGTVKSMACFACRKAG